MAAGTLLKLKLWLQKTLKRIKRQVLWARLGPSTEFICLSLDPWGLGVRPCLEIVFPEVIQLKGSVAWARIQRGRVRTRRGAADTDTDRHEEPVRATGLEQALRPQPRQTWPCRPAPQRSGPRTPRAPTSVSAAPRFAGLCQGRYWTLSKPHGGFVGTRPGRRADKLDGSLPASISPSATRGNVTAWGV